MTFTEIHLDLPARNAIDHDFLDVAEAALRGAGGGPILLRGTEKAFCAGLNLKFLPTLSADELEAFLVRADAFFGALWHHPGPVVACVEGHAIAGGAVVLQACDLRIGTDRADVRIGVNELALGACYPPNALRIMETRLGAQHATRVILGAELFAPQAALAVGLLDRVEVDPSMVARAEIERLASFPADAYRYIKAQLREPLRPSAAEVAQWRGEALAQWRSPALLERIRAALGG
ncbi:MAG: enoyl-CoA hydratase/isomerase family protein [Planctomycetota bacterium]|nr:enoyl-CoA hydratase/isomerase family protein [Planctomycetota bacterium]